MQPPWPRNGSASRWCVCPCACKRSESHGETWGSLKAGAALGSCPKPRDICRKHPRCKTEDVLTCVTVLFPPLLSFVAVSVEVTRGGRTHRATHTCMTAWPHSSGQDSLLQQPGSLSTQRPGTRRKQHTNMGGKCHPNGEKLK